MRHFFSNLVKGFRTTGAARGNRRLPRRAMLQVEGLEHRWVPTTVTPSGSSLLINNIAPGHTITIEANSNQQIEVFDGSTLVNQNHLVAKASINAVNIQLAGGDQVVVNDSSGMPFAYGTSISLFGFGANSLTLTGSRAVSGNETYVAGGASNNPGKVFLDNSTFTLGSAIASVNDSIPITGLLDVQTSGTNVVLSGSNGATQKLSGMGFGGGDTLTYSAKPEVSLDVYAVNGVVSLNATAPAYLEKYFWVQMHGAGDSTVIAATPSQVTTYVQSISAPVANNAFVYLEANAGPVAVFGNSSTEMIVGAPVGSGNDSTHGIQATVSVNGVGLLFVSDGGNNSTQEYVTVTESTISGSGLFGNSGVKLFYSNVGTVSIIAGQLADSYLVEGSYAGAEFTSQINIFSNTSVRFNVQVNLNSHSHLNLGLYSSRPDVSELFIDAPGASLYDPGTYPNGVVDAYFAGGFESQVAYNGFDLVAGD